MPAARRELRQFVLHLLPGRAGGLDQVFRQVGLRSLGVLGENSERQIAERTGGLGGTAHGTVQTAAERTFLVPYPLGIAGEKQHVFAISGTLAAFGQSLREAVGQATKFGDVDTADMLTEISRGVDNQLWFVESHLDPR